MTVIERNNMTSKLTDYLVKDVIILNSDAATNEDIIRLLAEKLEKLGFVKSSYCQAVIDREKQLPTGLPLERVDNVAIPHTDSIHVLKPCVGFATLKNSVNFANMEEPDEWLPIRYVFMLAINDKDQQIEMLQQIIMTIQDDAMLESLKNAIVSEEVLSIIKAVEV